MGSSFGLRSHVTPHSDAFDSDRVVDIIYIWGPLHSYAGPKTPRCFAPPTGFVRMGWYGSGVNDPSAGSPTETLLRLLLPLNDKVQATSRR